MLSSNEDVINNDTNPGEDDLRRKAIEADLKKQEALKLGQIRREKALKGKKILTVYTIAYVIFFLINLAQKASMASAYASMYMRVDYTPDLIRGLITLVLLLQLRSGKNWARVVTIILAVVALGVTFYYASMLLLFAPHMFYLYLILYSGIIGLLAINSNVKALFEMSY